MLKRFLIGFAAIVVIVAIIFYYKLGGNASLEFQQASHPVFYVTGQYFEGRYNDPKLEELFFSARKRAEETASGALTVITYEQESSGKVIRQFVGVGSLEPTDNLTNDLEVRILPRHEVLYTTIRVHNFVMPTAEQVKEEAEDHARKQGYSTDTLSYEIYTSDMELKVSFPLKGI